jgi:large subunit ribosomal protein L29
MEAKELRNKSAEQLHEELLSLRREQFALRLQRATGQNPKPDQFSKVRRNLARVKTVQRELRATKAGAAKGARAGAGEKA